MSSNLWYYDESDIFDLQLKGVLEFEELGFPYLFSIVVTFEADVSGTGDVETLQRLDDLKVIGTKAEDITRSVPTNNLTSVNRTMVDNGNITHNFNTSTSGDIEHTHSMDTNSSQAITGVSENFTSNVETSSKPLMNLTARKTTNYINTTETTSLVGTTDKPSITSQSEYETSLINNTASSYWTVAGHVTDHVTDHVTRLNVNGMDGADKNDTET